MLKFKMIVNTFGPVTSQFLNRLRNATRGQERKLDLAGSVLKRQSVSIITITSKTIPTLARQNECDGLDQSTISSFEINPRN